MTPAPARSLSAAFSVSVRMVLAGKSSQVWTLPPDATVFEAISLMANKSIGAVPVLSNGSLVGILSERDYARKVILSGRSSKNTLIREIMALPVISVTPDETVENCMRLMTEKRIRHLPVVQGTQLVGVVSIGDLIKTMIRAQAEEIRQLNAYIAGEYPG